MVKHQGNGLVYSGRFFDFFLRNFVLDGEIFLVI